MTTTAEVPTSTTRGFSRRVVAAQRHVANAALDSGAWLARRTEGARVKVRPVTSVVSSPAWVVLILGLVAAITGPLLGWIELGAVAGVGLVLLLVAVAFVVGTHQLTATLDLNRDRVVVGERAHGRILLANQSNRRTLPLTIELPVAQARAGFDLPSLASEATFEDLFIIPTNRRMVIPVGPVTAVRSDPLALLRREQHLADAELLYVHPRTVRIDGSAAGMIRDLEGQTVRKLTDSDVAFHALRAYVPGDDRRFIHWKTTARTGQMMVRQFEETRRSHLLVGMSTRLDDYAQADEFELAISIAGSLGVQTLVEGQALSVGTSTRTLKQGTARTLLDQLSAVEFERLSPRLSDVMRKLSSDTPGVSVAIIVCGSLVDSKELRRARRHLPLDVRVIALRAQPGADTKIRPMGDLYVATLGDLDDLPGTIRRLAL